MSEVSQLCLTLWETMDCSLQGSSVRGIFQARVLECVAISFSRGSSQPRGRTQVSRTAVRLFTIWATRETLAFQGIFLYLYLFYQDSRHSAFRLTFFVWSLILTGPFLWVFWSTIFYLFEQLWFGMHDSLLLYYYSSPLSMSNILFIVHNRGLAS